MRSYGDNFFIEIDDFHASYDLTFLRMFYTPLIHAEAINFYCLLLDLQKNNDYLKRTEVHKISAYSGLDLPQLLNARRKLEAVGLLRTYQDSSETGYIFKLIRPLDARKFIKNKILSKKLEKALGELEFEELINNFLTIQSPKEEYQEVSAKYIDIFEIPNIYDSSKESEWQNYEVNEAISKLPPSDFVKFLTKYSPSTSLLQAVKELSYLSFNALNEILYYSFVKNNKQTITPNHVLTIAKDLYFQKRIRTATDIHTHLAKALQQDGKIEDDSNKKLLFGKPNSTSKQQNSESDEAISLEDIFRELQKI